MLEIGMFLVDRYEILAKIGTGGMADVYKAKDHVLGRIVAVKLLKAEYSEDVSFVTKFRTEAQSAAGLEHPNIVNIYDVGSENGCHFIVMEHIEGITLKTYIEKKGQLPFKEATSIAIQIARGIEAAHNKGIIHRDIKPHNIIISTDGKVKVTDFGIARASTSNTISADVMGSVHYASPEQARNGVVDGRSDIYSLGIVMYEMVTGRVPFDGETTVAVALQHLQEEMVGPSTYAKDLPISYEKIVLKSTQKNPDRRYQSIEEFLADLRKALVSPNEDFVVIAPMAVAPQTRIIGAEEVEQIKANTKDTDLEAETKFAGDATVSKSKVEEEDDEDDDEDASGILNPKMEKIVTYVGIGILALIIGLIIYFIISFVNLINPDKPKTPGSEHQTEVETETEIETETESEELVSMINIVGMSVEDATKKLDKLGLRIFVGAKKESNKKDGTILEQDIVSGKEVPAGSTITVIVAGEDSSMEMVTVPSVVGKTREEAVAALIAAGLQYDPKFMISDEVEKGLIIKQSPEEGENVKNGTKVTFYISEGKETLRVPADLVGKTYEEVKASLEGLGFIVNPVQEKSDLEENTVLKVANSGKIVDKGSTIDVTISAGKESFQVPTNLVGKKIEEVKKELEKLGFVVDEVKEESEKEAGIVLEVVNEGKELEKGSTVIVKVSQGPKEKKYKVNQSFTAPTYTEGDVSAYEYVLKDAQGTVIDKNSGTGNSFSVSKENLTVKEGTITITWTVTSAGNGTPEGGTPEGGTEAGGTPGGNGTTIEKVETKKVTFEEMK